MRDHNVKELIIKTTDYKQYRYDHVNVHIDDRFLVVRDLNGSYNNYKMCFLLNNVINFSFVLEESEAE